MQRLRIAFKKAEAKSNSEALLGRAQDSLAEFVKPFWDDPETYPSAYDTRYIVGEILANYIDYDDDYGYVEVEGRIDPQTFNVEIEIVDDGNGFDPLDPESPCKKIRAAANHLKITAPASRMRGATSFKHTAKIQYNLKVRSE